MKPVRITLLTLLLCVCSQGHLAEPITDEKVRETVELYMDSMREGDYDTMSQLMHPAELEQLKQLFIVIAKKAEADGEFAELGVFLDGINSLRELEKTPAPVFFSKLMTSLVRFSPELGQVLKSAEVTLLGQVSEGEEGPDQLLHIVYRIEFELEGTPIKSVAVSTMKRNKDGRYGFLVDEQARGVVTALQKRFGVE